MKNEQKRLKQKLTLSFYINIIALFAITIYLLINIGIGGKSETRWDFTMERFGIIFALIIIPLSLKFFHSRYLKIANEEFNIFLKKLNGLFLFRMIALDAVIIFNLACFYMIGAINFAYLAGLTLLVFLICYPIKSILEPTMDNNNSN